MGFYSSGKVWKKDETAALIALFETERCLYDPSDRDFHDSDRKAEAYQRICKIMLRIRPDVSVDEIQYKIKVLQKQYEGEVLHRNISIETGLCTKDSYKPGMWCFGLLQFLDDYLGVKCVEEANKIEEDSDKEMYHAADTDDHLKDIEESSDVVDESDDNEDIEKIMSCKKRKVESSSSSERESLNSSIKKYLSSSSEKKLQNNSFSVKKFQSSSSIEKKHQNSSSLSRKFHRNSSSNKKITKPSSAKKSLDISSSIKKSQNALPSHKNISNTSASLRKLQSTPSVQKVPNFSKFERNRKHSSSLERELKNSSLNIEPKSYSPERILQNQPSLDRNLKSSFSAPNETKINLLEKELFNNSFSGKEFDVTEKVTGQNSIDREDIFGRYVASELRALRSNPLLYLQTKQSILENLTSANFELINPE